MVCLFFFCDVQELCFHLRHDAFVLTFRHAVSGMWLAAAISLSPCTMNLLTHPGSAPGSRGEAELSMA